MAVIPNQGSTGGGDAVTLTGSHFTGTTSVLYGTRRAASFTVLSASTTATVTPSGHGPVPVSVTTPGGTGVVGSFYYLPPPSASPPTRLPRPAATRRPSQGSASTPRTRSSSVRRPPPSPSTPTVNSLSPFPRLPPQVR
ncbi:hypothetical protein SHIRM173S_09586 [Streptomyces hirsutus]